MAKKENKKSASPILTIMITILALTMVTLAVVLYAYINGTTKPSQERYNPNLIEKEMATEQLSIKINMESCMIPVGTKVLISATIYPNGSQTGVIWKSSDENVITIDDNGNLQAVGVGVAALTANFADAYDSIAIECVQNESDAMLNLPSYSMFVGNSVNNNDTSNQDSSFAGQNNQSTENKDNTQSSDNLTQSATSANQTTSDATQDNSSVKQTTPAQTVTAPSQTQATQTTPAQTTTAPTNTTPANTKPPKTEAATIPTLPTTVPYEGVKVLSTEIAQDLPNYGFNKYLDNTYVYQENNAYLGEIIISSNMTHIYIKDRSAGFDTAISGVLNVLLPESASSIWNTYMTASTDQTVNVDGRVVRVVVPGDSGHSQIVIYN